MLNQYLRWFGGRSAITGLAFILFAVTVAQPMRAQVFRGTISGTVTDQKRLPILEAEVTLTNQATGTGSAMMTNKDGLYQFPALEPGTYSIEFSKSGFQTRSISNIEVKASEESTLSPTLFVKDVNVNFDVHEVVAGTSLNKTDATIQENLRNHMLDFIPMGTSSLVPSGSRNFARFALLAPGVARVLGQNEFSANGHRGRENAYLVDGVSNLDNTVTLPALLAPPEAIQELLIQVVPFSSEYGGKMGAQVNAITRSGGNSYHGEAWEFYRGSALEPLSLQSRRAGLTSSPRLVDNQFGADFGGPILKNKTFFYGVFEANRQRQAPKPFGAVTIPTAAGLATLAGVPLRPAGPGVTAQTPESRQAMLDELSFLNSVYPAISHYDSFPSPISVNGTPVEVGTYNPLIPQNQNLWYGLARIDHQWGTNNKLSYRVHIDDRDSPLSTGNLAFGERWGADSTYFAQNHALSYIRTINQNLVNEFRLAYTRLDPSFIEKDPVSPTVTLNGLFTIGGSANFPQQRKEQSYQLQDVATYIVNRHSFKFGVDLNNTNLFTNSAPNSKGTWVFPNLQSFLNNQPSSLTQLVSSASTFTFNQLRQSYFVQDDIRLRPSLTVNLGLRYETTSIPLGYFGATDPLVLAAGVDGPVKRDTNNWAPRVGFAYSPTATDGILGKALGGGKGSIRGGFGVGYDVLFYALLATPATNYPRSNTQVTPSTSLVDVYPTLAPKTSVPIFSPLSQFANIPADAQNPTTNYWSLSVQREVKETVVVEVGYTGNRSYHLIQQGQANPGILSQAKADAVIAGCTATTLSSCQDPAGFASSPSRLDPTLGTRILLETNGNATYNAGYIQVSKRSSFGLQFGANYTWSANLSDSEEYSNDISSVDGGIAGSSPQLPQNFLDRRSEKARSVFDRPQRLTFHESYTIPFFSDAPKVLRQAFAGWQASAFTEVQSGQPFTITVGADTLGAGSATPGRPDLNPGGILILDPTTNNLRTFTIPLDGTGIVTAPHVTDSTGKVTFLKNSMPTGGTLGRNTFRGPGFSNTNMSLMKRFALRGERTLEVRSDFINVFNHDNFPNPDADMSHATFGKQVFVPLTDARQVLLGVKIRF